MVPKEYYPRMVNPQGLLDNPWLIDAMLLGLTQVGVQVKVNQASRRLYGPMFKTLLVVENVSSGKTYKATLKEKYRIKE